MNNAKEHHILVRGLSKTVKNGIKRKAKYTGRSGNGELVLIISNHINSFIEWEKEKGPKEAFPK